MVNLVNFVPGGRLLKETLHVYVYESLLEVQSTMLSFVEVIKKGGI